MSRIRGLRAMLGAVLFATALPTTALPVFAQSAADLTQLHEAAKKDGELTWYVAHYSAENAEAVAKVFSEKFDGVRVNVVRSTAQVAYQRLSQDARANTPQCDVFSSTDMGHYTTLKAENALLKFRPKNADTIIEAFRNIDPDDTYHTTAIGLVLITYNKDKVKEADAPKSWKDLLDPKWKGQVSVGHPGFSGYVGTWVVTMRKLYGWDYFEELEKNEPRVGRSVNDTVTMLNAGESTVAAGPSAVTLTSAARGNPLGLIYPSDGTVLIISPSAIPRNAPHPNAAKLFMEFLMSPDYSKVGVEFFNDSMHASVPGAAGTKPLNQVKTIRPTVEEIETGIPEVKEQWRDTFGS